MEVLMRKELGGVRPDSESAFKALGNIKSGTVVTVDIKDPRKRSVEQHRLFFALLNRAFDNQSHFDNINDFRFCLLIRAGFFKSFTMKDGDIIKIADSIAFGNMEQQEFNDVIHRVSEILADVIGCTKEELLAEIDG